MDAREPRAARGPGGLLGESCHDPTVLTVGSHLSPRQGVKSGNLVVTPNRETGVDSAFGSTVRPDPSERHP